MSQWEEEEWSFTEKFSKGCFVVKALLASEEEAKSTEEECKSFPHSKAQWKRLAGKMTGA